MKCNILTNLKCKNRILFSIILPLVFVFVAVTCRAQDDVNEILNDDLEEILNADSSQEFLLIPVERGDGIANHSFLINGKQLLGLVDSGEFENSEIIVDNSQTIFYKRPIDPEIKYGNPCKRCCACCASC